MRAPGFQHVQEGHSSSQDVPLPPLRHQIPDADFGSRGRGWFRLGGHTWASSPRGPRLPAGPGQRQRHLHHPRQQAGECQATWAAWPARGSPRYRPDSCRVFGTFFTCMAGGFRKGRGKGNTGFRTISFILCRHEKVIIADAGFISPSVWSLTPREVRPSAFSLSGTALPPARGVPCSLVHPFLAGKKVVAQVCPLLAVRRI